MICLHEIELLLHVDLGDPLEHRHQVEVVAGLDGGAVGAEADAQVSGKKRGNKVDGSGEARSKILYLTN